MVKIESYIIYFLECSEIDYYQKTNRKVKEVDSSSVSSNSPPRSRCEEDYELFLLNKRNPNTNMNLLNINSNSLVNVTNVVNKLSK